MMQFHRRSLLLALGLFIAISITACGMPSTPTTSTANTQPSASTQTNKAAGTQQKAMGNGTQTSGTQQNGTQNQQSQGQQNMNQNGGQNNGQMQGSNQQPGAIIINTKKATLNGQSVTILTTFNGMALYQSNADPVPNSSCTGACAKTWPPLLSNGSVASTSSVNGTLTVQTTANGKQVTFNGHPLYMYSGDTASGQINGQGAANGWNAVTVQLRRQHW